MSGRPRFAVALETSARPASIAARGPGGGAAVRSLDDDRSHASDLLVELASLSEEVGAARRDLDLVIVGTGPGSYTGLRVGAATALGLHRGSGAALVGVPSFEVIAFGALAEGETGVVLRNAFSGLVYVGAYRRTAGDVEVVRAPECVRPDEFAQRAVDADALLVDEDGRRALGDAAEGLDVEVRPVGPAHAEHLLTLGLARFARDGAGGAASIQPLYLRPFEAKVRRR